MTIFLFDCIFENFNSNFLFLEKIRNFFDYFNSRNYLGFLYSKILKYILEQLVDIKLK